MKLLNFLKWGLLSPTNAYLMGLVSLWAALSSGSALPCSAFSPTGSPILAANYDWQVGGGMILTNASGWSKSAFLTESHATKIPVKWTSVYSSLTLTQWGREFPVQGMNSAGLTGIILNGPMQLQDAGSRPAISEQQWLQYQLDLYASLDDVERHLSEVQIAQVSGNLHYFFCDASQECAWVEFYQGHAILRKSPKAMTRAVTNSSFESSQERWKSFLRTEGNSSSLPQTYHSLDRFVRAAWFSLQSTAGGNVLAGLHSLSGPGLTVWHSLFNTAEQSAKVFPYLHHSPTEILRSEFDRNCHEEKWPLSRDLVGISFSEWGSYDAAKALNLLNSVAKPVQGFTPDIMKAMIRHPASFECH